MANKDSKRDRCESSSSDDCVFVNESVLSSDDELNRNISASKLDLSTSSLSNAIIDTSFTAKPLITRRFTLNKAKKIDTKYIKNKIEDICNLFQNEALAHGKKKVNFTINIKTIPKHKSKNVLKPLQQKKIKSKNKETFHNQSSSSSKTKSEDINYKEASNSKETNCELVIKNNLTEDNSINVNKNETKKCLQNTDLNINVGTESAKNNFTQQSISSNKNESKNEYFKDDDTTSNGDANTEIINTSINISNETETKKCLPNRELNINVGTESAKLNFTEQNISSNKNESKNEYRNDDDATLNGSLNVDIKNNFVDMNNQKIRRTDDKNLVHDNSNDLVVDSENTFDNNCFEMWESYYDLNKSDASCLLELPDKTIDNTLTNITADFLPTCLGSLPGLDTSTNYDLNRKDIDDVLEDKLILDDNEMPCVTFKTRVPKKKKPIDDFVDKIFLLRIENILKSKLIQKDPDIFLFQNIKYRFVRINGTVSYLNRVSNSKIFMKINDGTEEIFCCFQDFPDRLSHRISIANHFNKQSEKKLFFKKQLLAMGKKRDIVKIEEFMQKNTPGDNPFLNSFTKIILEKISKKQPPINKDIHLGDLLTIVGKVIDLNERLIYVWRIRKERKTLFENQQELSYSEISELHEIYSDAWEEKEFIYCNI